jgi:MFS family permease
VPSGYFSDRVGRRITIILSASGFVLANLVFLSASGLSALIVAQFFLALGMAFLSGTDSAFLYDSLAAAGREPEYGECEARGQKYSMVALALASMGGGLLGLLDLRLPYALALCGALWMLWLAWGCSEPPSHRLNTVSTGSFAVTLRECLGLLRDRVLAWLFGVVVLMYCLEHIAYEFYQPYIRLLGLQWQSGDASTVVSGMVIGLSMFGGAVGAMLSIRLYRRLGLRALLYLAFLAQLLIVAGLSLVLAPWMLATVLMRNFPMALIRAPVQANIVPRVGGHLRATYLSLQSLTARLVFSALLLVLARAVDQQALDWSSLSLVLRGALAFGVIGTVVIVLSAGKVPPRHGPED